MGYSGPKASNIYQNPGVKNNSDIKNPSLSGVGSPAKLGPLAAVAGKAVLGAVVNKAADKIMK